MPKVRKRLQPAKTKRRFTCNPIRYYFLHTLHITPFFNSGSYVIDSRTFSVRGTLDVCTSPRNTTNNQFFVPSLKTTNNITVK
jgi:hypothetical protein